jgi:hypothetical protein
MSWLPQSKIADCDGADVNPGWSAPVQVDKPPTKTLVFPWLVASGTPGRVAVAWYGSTTEGVADSASFKGPWDVYVAQSLNAQAASPTWQQVKATAHPLHYDQVCLSGLACTTGGDRSLADFFAMALDPKTGRLIVVYDEDGKEPDGLSGPIAVTHIVAQSTGVSNDATKTLPAPRAVIRTAQDDPEGDAQSPYSVSSLTVPEAPPAASQANHPALDVQSIAVGPEADVTTGEVVPGGGGFTITMKVKDLGAAALQSALTGSTAQSLVWAFRWVNGFRPASLSVHWDPARGFAGGFDDYATGSATCLGTPSTTPGAEDAKCMTYPGTVQVPMHVNADNGTITMTAPANLLKALGPADDDGRPTEVDADKPGTSRFYSGTVFTMANVSVAEAQSFLYPVDGTAAFDFVLPGGTAGGGTGGGGGTGTGGGNSGGGTIPTTGGLGWPLAAVTAAGAAVVGLRLRRRAAHR